MMFFSRVRYLWFHLYLLVMVCVTMHLAYLDHSTPDYLSRVLAIKLNMACPKYCIVLKSHITVNDADL